MPIIAQKFELSLLKKEQVAKNTDSFYFARPAELDFLPGQFMRLFLNLPQPTDRGNGRFFSIASSPSEKQFLMITVRIRDSDFKQTLLNLKEGTKIQIALPYGSFTLKPEETIPHVFLAGGIGITPFRSMIRYAADTHLTIPITLLTSSSIVEDIVFQKELKEIEAKNSWFRLIETITQPENSKLTWSGNIGRIDENYIKRYVPDFGSAIFYIAGPPAMVDAMDNLLKLLRIEVTKIRKEKFTGY